MYYKLILEVLGGLALFIFGINRLSNSLQKITSNRLKSVINIVAKRSWSAVLVGLFTTMLIQSSSATSVMTVGFVNAGLMTLRQAIGIVMGANIGTTITAQIVSFKIDILAKPGISYTTKFIGTLKGYDRTVSRQKDDKGNLILRYSEDIGEVLSEQKGAHVEYKLTGDELYVRAKIISTARHPNPTAESKFEVAWVQPVQPKFKK